ncbi:oligomeric, coiled-coil, peripheral membrane protein [Rhodotorula mucilaginosa]|uniref:Autophagy-related protein 11 n=1 Tax=Rhodotorula mucilaginosa TaxID=5537 RepID=A0A9P7B966_RHOMI|nr:oligomeric, coiled-coil, peripheral membrane protein [Rhodotorula mucilaginosa]
MPAPRPSLSVVRSSDGAEFPLHRDDFRNITTLDELRYNLLSPLLSIPPECLILMNEEGAPIARDEAVRHLLLLASTPTSSVTGTKAVPRPGDNRSPTGSIVMRGSGSSAGLRAGSDSTTRRIYVFDRDHLDSDPDEVAAALSVSEEMVLGEPPLNLEDPLPSHLSLSQHHLFTLQALVTSIHLQIDSLALALANLRRVNSGTFSSFSLFLESAQPTMQRYERLLEGWEGAMDAVSKVAVISGLLTRTAGSSAGNASTVGVGGAGGQEKQRYLGDYVSREKMLAVRDGCAKVLAELKLRTEDLQATLDTVTSATEAVEGELDVTKSDLLDLEACTQDAEQGHLRIEELVHAGSENPELLEQCFAELSHADAEHRDRIRFLIERKNAMTKYFLQEMQKISALQSDVADVPAELAALDHDLGTRTDNFKHLSRLEGLIPAYVATVAEVIRRREYARLLSQHSGDLTAIYRPLAELERQRRTHYRQTHSGKLPWEVRGLSGSTSERIPEMALEVVGGEEGLPDISSASLDKLASTLSRIDEAMGQAANIDTTVRQARQLVKDLGVGIENLREEFARLSRDPPAPRHDMIDPARVAELEEQVRTLETAHEHLNRKLQDERSGWEEETAKLESRASTAEDACARLRADVDELQRARSALQQEQSEARHTARDLQQNLEKEVKRREVAERDLATAAAGEAELRKQWATLSEAHTRLQSEVSALRLEHEQRGATIEELRPRLEVAQRAQQELSSAVADKDKLLRDQRADAELDRAVLEKETDALRRLLADKDTRLEELNERIRLADEGAATLREQVERWEQLAHSKEVNARAEDSRSESAAREAAKALVNAEKESALLRRLAIDALNSVRSLRLQGDQIVANIASTAAPPRTDDTLPERQSSVDDRQHSDRLPEIPTGDVSSSDLRLVLEKLNAFDQGGLDAAVNDKVETLTAATKRWIKEAKAYRERAHRAAANSGDKIAFRNFAKGDLALFLPTRNSAVPVWAAFNVSFPHHFLSATGVIAEQMKTREWIVARITAMTEKVVDAKDPSTNPYLLASGTKYFMLEVEPWSSKESSRRRRTSADKGSSSEKKGASSGARGPVVAEPGSSPETTKRSKDGGTDKQEPWRPSSAPPGFRRSVSEGAPLPPNATDFARTEFTIPEAEDEDILGADSPTPSPPAPVAAAPAIRANVAGVSSPSGISRALATSAPSTPAIDGSDPFAVPPLDAQDLGLPPRPRSSSPRDYSPSTRSYDLGRVASEAMPAFLPSPARRQHRNSVEAIGASIVRGPRYPGAIDRAGPPAGIPRAPMSNTPAAILLSSSPASTSASSVHVVSQPRSVTSASGILSASIHRRGSGTMLGTPSPGQSVKAPPTSAAQLVDSQWDTSAEAANVPQRSAATKVSRGWPTSSRTPPDDQPAPTSRPSVACTPSKQADAAAAAAAAHKPGILDVLTGKRPLSTRPAGSARAESEMRKLLGQPPM